MFQPEETVHFVPAIYTPDFEDVPDNVYPEYTPGYQIGYYPEYNPVYYTEYNPVSQPEYYPEYNPEYYPVNYPEYSPEYYQFLPPEFYPQPLTVETVEDCFLPSPQLPHNHQPILPVRKHTLITNQDPSDGGRDIMVNGLLGGTAMYPPESVFPPKSVSVPPASPPESASLLKPVSPPKPASPTEPVSPPKPASPTEPVSPTEPASPTEPMSPPKPASPTEPVSPTEPASPPEPMSPPKPASPPEPVSPPKPASPTEPVSPPEPASPIEPVSPPKPVSPLETMSQLEPVQTDTANTKFQLEETVHFVPATNTPDFEDVPDNLYPEYNPMYYPEYSQFLPPEFYPKPLKVETVEEDCFLPSPQPPHNHQTILPERKHTLITNQDPSDGGQDIMVNGLLGGTAMYPPESVFPPENVSAPQHVSPPEPASLLKPVSPPTPASPSEPVSPPEHKPTYSITNTKAKGYGYITYSSEAEAKTAIREMNGKVVGTDLLNISLYETKNGTSRGEDETQLEQKHVAEL